MVYKNLFSALSEKMAGNRGADAGRLWNHRNFGSQTRYGCLAGFHPVRPDRQAGGVSLMADRSRLDSDLWIGGGIRLAGILAAGVDKALFTADQLPAGGTGLDFLASAGIFLQPHLSEYGAGHPRLGHQPCLWICAAGVAE
ncbi:hypothetical protein D3C81_1214530 [compost metagenome]